MAQEKQKGVGKCEQNHPGSYGYPTRPEERYPFCAKCGTPMVWECQQCAAGLPEDSAEMETARFCRECGASYFGEPLPNARSANKERS